jgi:hypothetical protein
MQHTTRIAFTKHLQQGPTLSIVARDLIRQASTETSLQAQGIFVPIFGAYCLSEPLT